jgi:hypothetical protein
MSKARPSRPSTSADVDKQPFEFEALQGYDTITIGHDTPVDRSAIDSTMTYVKRAKEIHAASADPKTYSERLKAAFPELRQVGFVDLSASYLYAVPH